MNAQLSQIEADGATGAAFCQLLPARLAGRRRWVNRWHAPTPREDQHGTQGGFTSIELLVVIGIMAICITLFLPTLTQHKGRASVGCRNNLRQIGFGFMMYAQDYTDTLVGWGWEFHEPPYADPPDRRMQGAEKQADLSTGKLWSYLGKSSGVFRCPTYTLRKSSTPGFWGFNSVSPIVPYPLWSYAVNATAGLSCRPATQIDNNVDLRMSALHSPPATTLLVLELNDSMFDNGVAMFDGTMPADSQDNLGTRYHAGVGNLAFMDGHATCMTWKQYTNAAAGLGQSKQFFGGNYGFYW
jgi:prepilin-type processing-associated H-X9-DG protein